MSIVQIMTPKTATMDAPSHVIADIDLDVDASFFAPDSVTWKIMLGPYAAPALMSMLAMFEAYPPCALMGSKSVAYDDPVGRSTRTLEYIYLLTFGKQRDAQHIIAHVNALHDTVKCEWQGREYCASEPRSLLWLFVPFFTQLMDIYDAFGSEPLTAEERDQLWREVKVIGLVNRIPEEMIPTSQAQAQAYLDEMRPLLSITAEAADMNRLVFAKPWSTEGFLPLPLTPLVAAVLESGVAFAPEYVLRMYGTSRSPLARKAVIAAYRPAYKLLEKTPGLRDAFPMIIGKPYVEMVREARAARAAALADARG